MLRITLGQDVKVNYVRAGVDKEGNTWTLVAIAENQNSESKSKAHIKCWGTQLPEGIQDGCTAKLVGLSEIVLAHEKYGEKYGKPLFRDSYEVRGAIFSL